MFGQTSASTEGAHGGFGDLGVDSHVVPHGTAGGGDKEDGDGLHQTFDVKEGDQAAS